MSCQVAGACHPSCSWDLRTKELRVQFFSKVALRTPVLLTTGDETSMKTYFGAGGPENASTSRKEHESSLSFLL